MRVEIPNLSAISACGRADASIFSSRSRAMRRLPSSEKVEGIACNDEQLMAFGPPGRPGRQIVDVIPTFAG